MKVETRNRICLAVIPCNADVIFLHYDSIIRILYQDQWFELTIGYCPKSFYHNLKTAIRCAKYIKSL